MTESEGASCPVHFDHHSAEFASDPWDALRHLRSNAPIAYSDAYGGFWVLSRYEDIKRVALDDRTFSSASSILIPPKKNTGQRSIPIETDPPIFFEYRKLLQPLFAPVAIDRLEPVIEALVNRCIDRFIESGECDFVHDVASPLPAMVTLNKLGLPIEDWEKFAGPLHQTVFLRQDNPSRAEALAGLRWVREVITEAVSDRRAHPRDDMITYLTRATIEGRPIYDEEVVEMVSLTIQGGFDTTGSAIGNALFYLDGQPEARQALIRDPALMISAAEEFLRFEAPQLALARMATRDVEIGGEQIREGDHVLLVWASGNRDEGAFPDADSVVLDRFPNRHMTFGLGAHRCLGSTLARRQLTLTLSAVLHRMPDYRIDRENAVRAETVGVTYGHMSLPARFTPGPRFSSLNAAGSVSH